MTKTFLNEMEEQLTKERDRLVEELSAISRQNPKNREDWDASFQNIGDEEGENAAEVDTYSTNLTLERTLEAGLRDVEKAIERVKKGNYGTCKYCGKEIDEKRLRARPASSSCIECKKNLMQEL